MTKDKNDQARMATKADATDNRTASTVAPSSRTPGPWRSEWRHPDLCVWGGPDDDHVASVYGDGSIENAEANARLIAAAPALLAACKAVDAHLLTTFPPYAVGQGPFDLVRAAILKAEGR